jgi:hypothetical protein
MNVNDRMKNLIKKFLPEGIKKGIGSPRSDTSFVELFFANALLLASPKISIIVAILHYDEKKRV